MSSLINNAMSGLNAAQAALNTASNNISSYNVAGYTRQTTIMAQANSTLGAGGWVGNGVYVSGVQREYDAFITNQLRAAQTQSSGLTARYEQMSKIDNMLSTSTSSLATQMQDFFTSLQTLVSNAEDPAARQALIGKSEGLVNQFKTTDQYLRDQDKQVNIAIGATVTDASAVLATDYKISFDNNQWQVTRLASNTTFTVTPDANGKVAFDGLELTFTGTPAVNDSFTLKPVSDAIVNMDVLITDEAKIAMASEENAGDSDNRNGQALLDLQSNSKTVGGAKSFNDAYASLVSDIGNKTATLKTSSTTQGNVVTQLSNQQQSISGVNLDEEYGNLQRFQQYYLANAQVLQTANAIFDALINIR
ncbi:flagellar hook-associated protein 1 [Escherichia coli]|uniref:FlgK family flagellar hook-associated protein n=1 Tax=Escherichia coli TaxID=562 RepID=UPI000DA5461B|nr:flagellar basal body rod C-terminal domain-containing protein [Escherichia coli]SQQ10195.1 flagellar hook-associated protein 1 [Escherichia coli]HCO8567696.1 flagellar hook-associated protein FlgK [Escherichia coli]